MKALETPNTVDCAEIPYVLLLEATNAGVRFEHLVSPVTEIIWDPDDPTETQRAAVLFAALLKEGYFVVRHRGVQPLQKFIPEIGRMYVDSTIRLHEE